MPTAAAGVDPAVAAELRRAAAAIAAGPLASLCLAKAAGKAPASPSNAEPE